jgi:hypothetical protein
MLLPIAFALALQAANPAPMVVLSNETMSQIEEPMQVVVRTPAEWADLWRKHAGASKLPAVDFNTRTVVGVFLGTRNTAGYAVEIIGTREEKGSLIVRWQERRPGRDVITAQVITSPAVIASIPKFAGPVIFEKAEK